MLFFWEILEKMLSKDDRIHVAERYFDIGQDLSLSMETDILFSSRFVEDPKGINMLIRVELVSSANTILGYHKRDRGRVFFD